MIDPDVQKLESFALEHNLSKKDYVLLTDIIADTVKHKLQEFADQFITWDFIAFKKEQIDMIKDKQTKTGLYEGS